MTQCHSYNLAGQRCDLDAHDDDVDHSHAVRWTTAEAWTPLSGPLPVPASEVPGAALFVVPEPVSDVPEASAVRAGCFNCGHASHEEECTYETRTPQGQASGIPCGCTFRDITV